MEAKMKLSWWRLDMEKLSVLLARCEGNPPLTNGFPITKHTNVNGLHWSNRWWYFHSSHIRKYCVTHVRSMHFLCVWLLILQNYWILFKATTNKQFQFLFEFCPIHSSNGLVCWNGRNWPCYNEAHHPLYSTVCWIHYSDVIMGSMASQIIGLTIVYSTVYSGADQRKLQSSASLAFVRGIHRWPVISPHEWPVRGKYFHLMTSSCVIEI